MIELTLPYPISANRYWVAIKIPGRTMLAPSKEAKAFKADVQRIASGAGLAKPLPGRLVLHARLFPRRPQDWQTRMRKLGPGWDDSVQCIDLGNCEKVMSDALQGIVIANDSQFRRIVLERMEPDELGARLVVRIAAAPAATGPQAVLVTNGAAG